jgi:hypothetical protein
VSSPRCNGLRGGARRSQCRLVTTSTRDVVAELDGALVRVQVKTSSFARNGRWEVTLCTRGGNRSWSGIVKRLDPSRFEYLFVHVADGRRWFIPSAALAGSSSIRLGGPKYGAFEVEPGFSLNASADVRAHAL